MATSADSPTAGEVRTDPTDAPVAEPTVTETNFPEAFEEDVPPVELMDQAAVTSNAEPGQIFATYVGPGADRVERILSVSDLKSLGDREATEPLRWDAANRHIVEVTDAHPLVLRYLEDTDAGFKVERF